MKENQSYAYEDPLFRTIDYQHFPFYEIFFFAKKMGKVRSLLLYYVIKELDT